MDGWCTRGILEWLEVEFVRNASSMGAQSSFSFVRDDGYATSTSCPLHAVKQRSWTSCLLPLLLM